MMVGNTPVKPADDNLKNKEIYVVGGGCAPVFDPESVHTL